MLTSTRRPLLIGLVGVLAVALGLFVYFHSAHQTHADTQPPPAPGSDKTRIPMMALMAPEALPDVVQGKADAPVTIVEYASMTCPHCAHFHQTVYPTLIKNYVDTGKVKFILREFPLDPIAAAGFMVARCEGDKRSAVVDLLFDKQNDWAFGETPLNSLADIVKQTGMGKDAFDKCLSDDKLRDAIYSVSDRGGKEFGVAATPTFFVNGTKVSGEITVDSLTKLLDPLVNKKS